MNFFQGGAWISTGDEASRFARFAFRRHFFQHLGFRLACSMDSDEKTDLPVRIVTDKVFVLGAEVLGNKIYSSQLNLEFCNIKT